MSKHHFKSTVSHLYHGHTTEKHPLRFEIFELFKRFDKTSAQEYVKQKGDDWGKPVEESSIWEYIDNTGINDYYNKDVLISMIKSKKPIITLCMVSYRRYKTLITTLEKYVSFNIPINLILWLNSYNDYTRYQLQHIKRMCKKLYSYDITYCNKNMGTGHPRNIMLSRAYKEYDTPYIMTTDDDILYNTEEEFLIGASILEQTKYYQYGAIGIWCDPIYYSLYVINDELKNYIPKKGFQNVDALGAATMTIKRKVLSKCNTDGEYKLGWVDTDFSFQIRDNNYKLGLLCDTKWKPYNVADKSDIVYKKARSDKNVTQLSKDRFIKKWGVTPVWSNTTNMGEYNGN